MESFPLVIAHGLPGWAESLLIGFAAGVIGSTVLRIWRL